MEFKNEIIIQGVVDTSSPVPGLDTVWFSVMTQHCSVSKDGLPTVDCTWFNVQAHKGEKITDLSKIQKGTKIYVKGRMAARRYVDSEGIQRLNMEVIANEINILND